MIKNSVLFSILFILTWSLFFATYKSFPYIRPGVDLVYKAKDETIRNGELFSADKKTRIAVLGDSKVLAGFVPSAFNRLSGESVESWNLGIGGTQFDLLTLITTICQKRTKPTHIFVTLPWNEIEPARFNPFQLIKNDKQILERLFPFRKLPRDLTLFLLRSHSNGGIAATYEKSRGSITDMFNQQGYYFIEGQSHFPGHRLPVDFKLDSDNPDSIQTRDFDMKESSLKKLQTLAETYDIQLLIAPLYKREGEAAAAPQINMKTRFLISHYNHIRLLGPDYFLLPPSFFSDPVHLNPAGAEVYTRKLSDLFTGTFTAPEKR